VLSCRSGSGYRRRFKPRAVFLRNPAPAGIEVPWISVGSWRHYCATRGPTLLILFAFINGRTSSITLLFNVSPTLCPCFEAVTITARYKPDPGPASGPTLAPELFNIALIITPSRGLTFRIFPDGPCFVNGYPWHLAGHNSPDDARRLSAGMLCLVTIYYATD